MLTFEKLSIKNFLSVGNNPMEIQLNKSPTTVIMGKNGQGKSTITDAINFALYGKPYRKINKPDLINSINNKDCSVELEFSTKQKQYKIVRGIKPNKFEIYENGNLINQSSDQRDYQEYLEVNLLGMNENAFKQIVLIGSANYTPFMQLDTAKRREVIEDLLDISIFSTMNVLLKGKISNQKETIRDLETKSSVLQEKKEFLVVQLQKQQDTSKQQINALETDLTALKQQVEDHSNQIDKITDDVASLTQTIEDDLDSKLNKIIKLQTQSNVQLNTALDTIKFFSNTNQCMTCKQTIEESHKQQIVSKQQIDVEKHQENLKKIDKVFKELKDKSNDQKQSIDKINQLKSDLSSCITSKKLKEKQIQAIEKQISDLSNPKSNTFEKDLEKVEQELQTIKQLLDEQIQIKQQYDFALKLLKDDGIKAKIVEQYIPQINYYCNQYLDQLGLPIQFTLDENFDETIQSRYRDKFKYHCFSEGEKCRIDNALLMTWREIAKNKNTTNTNLLFFDEVMDSSLDSNATEELLNILTNYNNTNVFIISHRADLSDKVRSVIEIEKHGNFTRIKPQKAIQ